MSTPNDFELYEFDLAKELMELPEEKAVRILREYRKWDYRIDHLFKKAIMSFFSLGYTGVFAAAQLPYCGGLAVQDESDRYNPPDIIHGGLRYEVKTAAYRRGQQNLLVNVWDHVGQPDIYILMVAHNPGHTTFAVEQRPHEHETFLWGQLGFAFP